MNPPAQHSYPLVDTHAHLDAERLRVDLEGVLDRAKRANVAQIIVIGTTATTSAAAVELSQTHRGLFAAVGIHPNEAAEAGQSDWSSITGLSNSVGVVALGETGLDRYWDRTPFGRTATVV